MLHPCIWVIHELITTGVNRIFFDIPGISFSKYQRRIYYFTILGNK